MNGSKRAVPSELVSSRLGSPVLPVAALLVSIAAYVAVTLLGPKPFEMVDLRVYYDSAWHLFDGSSLYNFESSSSIGLRFTYPPFAAALFAPLAWLPWTLCRLVWQLGSLAELWFIGRCSLHLADNARTSRLGRRPASTATLLTALALWTEPVRSTMNYGQINLFIAAALLAGLAARRTWIAGVTVGICAAVKLIPGITGLYYLLAGRLRTVAAAAVTALAAIGASFLVSPALTRQFFTDTIFNPARAGDLAAVNNQSLRGALTRILGHDDAVLWAGASVVLLAVGAVSARACVGRRDYLGGFLVVQIAGLLVSPISWNHHWIWVLPLIVWATTGPLRRAPSIRSLAALWLLVCCSFLVSAQIAQQTRRGGPPAAGWMPWAEALYPVLGIITIVAIWMGHRRSGQSDSTPGERPQHATAVQP